MIIFFFVAKVGCGETSSNNCTWIENPNYPQPFNAAGNCKQSIQIKENVCQVR